MIMKEIEEGMLVVAVEGEYDGLGGYIVEVRRDREEFETENESKYEIVVDFLETEQITETHPDLNGTSVGMVIMEEDELIYFPEGVEANGLDLTGKNYALNDVLITEEGYKEKVKMGF